MADIRYSIRKNRLENCLYSEGVEVEGNTIIAESAIRNCIFLKPIDTALPNSSWGRMHFKAESEGDMVYEICVAATDKILPDREMSYNDCNRMMKALGGRRYINNNDFLLYDQEGRFLFVAIIFKGSGTIRISDIRIDRQGDNFMQVFPQVYQDWGGFFHRFLSVFSSVYNDLEDEIDNLPRMLDLDTCDPVLLPVYGKWMGIDVGDGFLEEGILRNLVKEAYMLNRMKGTKWCIERITEIILGEKAMIAERNATPESMDQSQISAIERLYGKSIYDVTLLIQKSLSTTQKSQLEYILNQFIPIRCNLRVVELGGMAALDSYSYLDINARSHCNQEGVLGESSVIDAAITLA